MKIGSPRPTSVTVFALLSITLGGLSIITGLAAALLGFVVMDYSVPAATLLLTLAPPMILFGFLEIAYGIGSLEGKRWAWTLSLIVAIASLVSSIGLVVLSLTFHPVDSLALSLYDFIPFVAIIPIVYSSVALYILTRIHVKTFFGKGPKLPA